MPPLTSAHFERWLEAYSRASTQHDPAASAALFADGTGYYETPFANPMVGREAICTYWSKAMPKPHRFLAVGNPRLWLRLSLSGAHARR